MYIKFLKRTIDIVIAFLGFIFFLPLLIIVSVVLLFTNKGTPFYFQERPGKNAKLFKIIKFKSMTDAVDEHGNLLPYKERVTAIGNFIRKYSIDEVPQIINVLKGDMSIIGPRPLLSEYVTLYNDFQKRRHEVRPGISGWAQVNGRNAINWNEKFAYDVWYVDHVSFRLDFKIFLMTCKKAFAKEGINTNDNLNMPLFRGN